MPVKKFVRHTKAPKAFPMHIVKENKSEKLNEHDDKRNTRDGGIAAEASIIAFPTTELYFGFELNSNCFSFSIASTPVDQSKKE